MLLLALAVLVVWADEWLTFCNFDTVSAGYIAFSSIWHFALRLVDNSNYLMIGGEISLSSFNMKNMEEDFVSPHWLVTKRITRMSVTHAFLRSAELSIHSFPVFDNAGTQSIAMEVNL